MKQIQAFLQYFLGATEEGAIEHRSSLRVLWSTLGPTNTNSFHLKVSNEIGLWSNPAHSYYEQNISIMFLPQTHAHKKTKTSTSNFKETKRN